MQSIQIFLARNNVQAGPYSLEQVNTMLASKEVHLDDLAWHEGLENWTAIGELTHGELFYFPNGTSSNNTHQHNHLKSTVTIDSNDKNQHATTNTPEKNNRLTVDQLYGREPINKDNQSNTSDQESNEKIPNHKKVIRIQVPSGPHIGNNPLASIGSRIFAVFIDQLTLSMLFLPIWLNADTSDFSLGDNSYDAMNQMVQSTPLHIVTMVMIFSLAFLFIQIFLLIKKGQTIGKVVAGNRILDINTHKVPSITNILLLRTLLTQILYGLPLVGVFVLLIDFIIMTINPQRLSLHDKISKTYVAKASPSQLDSNEMNIDDSKR